MGMIRNFNKQDGTYIVKRMINDNGGINITFVIICEDEIVVTTKDIKKENNEIEESNYGKRKIGIELKQDKNPNLFGGKVKEELSGGGGIEYGKHEGGGVSLKLDIDSQDNVKDNVKEYGEHKYLDRNKRQDMMNLFFTW